MKDQFDEKFDAMEHPAILEEGGAYEDAYNTRVAKLKKLMSGLAKNKKDALATDLKNKNENAMADLLNKVSDALSALT